ncbi:MAG: Holliday junction resolvase-like protein [Acidobacteriota bacterium]|nr:MAG: Holliday junction resolvase-like protein [Acidobacteriota bacterium]
MSGETDWLLPFLGCVIAVLALLLVHSRIEMEQRIQRRLEEWRARELESRAVELHERWKLESEADIRRDAVRRSRAVVTGKVTEHLVPFMGEFPYNPKDVRFLGSPVDLVVFDGMDDDDLNEIVFVEVKTGASASLSTRERRIRDAVRAGAVRWHELRLD